MRNDMFYCFKNHSMKILIVLLLIILIFFLFTLCDRRGMIGGPVERGLVGGRDINVKPVIDHTIKNPVDGPVLNMPNGGFQIRDIVLYGQSVIDKQKFGQMSTEVKEALSGIYNTFYQYALDDNMFTEDTYKDYTEAIYNAWRRQVGDSLASMIAKNGSRDIFSVSLKSFNGSPRQEIIDKFAGYPALIEYRVASRFFSSAPHKIKGDSECDLFDMRDKDMPFFRFRFSDDAKATVSVLFTPWVRFDETDNKFHIKKGIDSYKLKEILSPWILFAENRVNEYADRLSDIITNLSGTSNRPTFNCFIGMVDFYPVETVDGALGSSAFVAYVLTLAVDLFKKKLCYGIFKKEYFGIISNSVSAGNHYVLVNRKCFRLTEKNDIGERNTDTFNPFTKGKIESLKNNNAEAANFLISTLSMIKMFQDVGIEGFEGFDVGDYKTWDLEFITQMYTVSVEGTPEVNKLIDTLITIIGATKGDMNVMDLKGITFDKVDEVGRQKLHQIITGKTREFNPPYIPPREPGKSSAKNGTIDEKRDVVVRRLGRPVVLPRINQNAQPSPIVNQNVQPSPIVNQNVQSQPSPIVNQNVQSQPLVNQNAQPSPIVNQNAQPSPIVNQNAQSPVNPKPQPQPSPIVNQNVQPSQPIVNQNAQPSPIVNQNVQPSPIVNQNVQPLVNQNVQPQPSLIAMSPVNRSPKRITPSCSEVHQLIL